MMKMLYTALNLVYVSIHGELLEKRLGYNGLRKNFTVDEASEMIKYGKSRHISTKRVKTYQAHLIRQL